MPAELIAEDGILKGLVLSLDQGEEWVIGRDPDVSTLLVEDPKASRAHLKVKKTEDGYLAENLSETNPVKINDAPLSEVTRLHDGDKVVIGSTLFHFYEEGAPAAIETAAVPEEEEELPQETLFAEEEISDVHFDLSQTARFVLKVIAGPNTGAEFALDVDKPYLIGTNNTTCDVVFHDLSVSSEHARLRLSAEGGVSIEDLGSRNGVVVDQERITGKHSLPPNTVVTLGTSAFLVLDREAPSVTIAAPILEPRVEEEEEEEGVEEEAPASVEEKEEAPKKPSISTGTLVLAVIVGGIAILLGIGMISLFRGSDVTVAPPDYIQEIQTATKPFSGVRFTYNATTGKLFLVGNVASSVEKSELVYNLRGLTFLKGVEDNIVVDEAVWQEMNLLLAKRPGFAGVSMHSPKPGIFVLTGYLKTEKQYNQLKEYMNLNFNYLDRLQNRVVVEQFVLEQVEGSLLKEGFNGVSPTFSNGELVLTGYINAALMNTFEELVKGFEKIEGVRVVRNFVVALSPEQAVVDLSVEYPGRYNVTGSSKHGDVNINVVINGRIYSRGDTIDGMTITSIQPNRIFLEKDGLQYKIEYSK